MDPIIYIQLEDCDLRSWRLTGRERPPRRQRHDREPPTGPRRGLGDERHLQPSFEFDTLASLGLSRARTPARRVSQLRDRVWCLCEPLQCEALR